MARKAKREDEIAQQEWQRKGEGRPEERKPRKLEGKRDKEKDRRQQHGTKGRECFKEEGMVTRPRLCSDSGIWQ